MPTWNRCARSVVHRSCRYIGLLRRIVGSADSARWHVEQRAYAGSPARSGQPQHANNFASVSGRRFRSEAQMIAGSGLGLVRSAVTASWPSAEPHDAGLRRIASRTRSHTALFPADCASATPATTRRASIRSISGSAHEQRTTRISMPKGETMSVAATRIHARRSLGRNVMRSNASCSMVQHRQRLRRCTALLKRTSAPLCGDNTGSADVRNVEV